MDEKEKQLAKLFAKELLPLFVGLRSELKSLGEKLSTLNLKRLPDKYKTEVLNFPESGVQEVKVINNQKDVEATIKNFPEPQKEIEVKGIDLLFANLYSKFYSLNGWMGEHFKAFGDSIKENVFRVKVENQTEIKFPEIQKVEVQNPIKQIDAFRITNSQPSEAIPVKLTSKDGKRFYEALQQIVGMGGDIDLSGIKQSLIDIKTAVQNIDIDADTINLNTDTLEGLISATNVLLTQFKFVGDNLKTTATITPPAGGFSTETTLSAILVAVDQLEGFTDGIEALLTTISGKDFATQATLATRASEATLIQVRDYLDTVETKLQTLIDNLTGGNEVHNNYKAYDLLITTTPTTITLLATFNLFAISVGSITAGGKLNVKLNSSGNDPIVLDSQGQFAHDRFAVSSFILNTTAGTTPITIFVSNKI